MADNTPTPMNNSLAVRQPDKVASFVEIRLDRERFPRLKDFKPEEAVTELARMIAVAYQLKGQRMEKERIFADASALYDCLNTDNEARKYDANCLTLEEIRRAVTAKAIRAESPICVNLLFRATMEYILTEGIKAEREARELREKAKGSYIPPEYFKKVEEYTRKMFNNANLNKK